MPFKYISEITDLLNTLMPSSTSSLSDEQVGFAANQALRELGWNLPLNDNQKEYWVIERAKRHLLDVLRVISASKFKYKQINLNQRFEHYNTLIKDMDDKYESAIENDPVFTGLDTSALFGIYIDNGFVYDDFGNDVTRAVFDLGYDIHN